MDDEGTSEHGSAENAARSEFGDQNRFFENGDEPLVARERRLAEIRHESGVRLIFSHDEVSGDFGLVQEGLIDESGPLVRGDQRSILAVFLAVTPENVAVPEILSRESPAGDLGAALSQRRLLPSDSTSLQLELELADTSLLPRAQGCYDEHYSWFDWHDHAEPGMAPKAYYSSNYGGKFRYTDSYVANCTAAGSGSWLWARHRIYYRNAFGNYVKQFEGKVPPGTWQAASRGSVRRYRRAIYDDGWNSSPNCGSGTCKYTREGRFSD